MFHEQNLIKIIAKLRWTIGPFKTHTSKEYLQYLYLQIIRVTFVRCLMTCCCEANHPHVTEELRYKNVKFLCLVV